MFSPLTNSISKKSAAEDDDYDHRRSLSLSLSFPLSFSFSLSLSDTKAVCECSVGRDERESAMSKMSRRTSAAAAAAGYTNAPSLPPSLMRSASLSLLIPRETDDDVDAHEDGAPFWAILA